METAQKDYLKFTRRSQLDKAINSLIGLVEGIAIDGVINNSEVGLFKLWLAEHDELRNSHPLKELVPVVMDAIEDGILEEDERKDILWLCERLRSTDFYDEVTADLQVLHGLLGGVAADGKITEAELRGLSEWLADHEHLKTCWPYDEVDSLVTSVMADGRISEEEHKLLKEFFSEFTSLLDDRTITSPLMNKDSTIAGVCAVSPEITFEGSTFCFTGESHKYKRADFEELVERLGGKALSGVTQKLDYLIIGANGNRCWAYACYGRKVERAVELRKQGYRLLIVHEHDFHDAVMDA